MKTRAIPRALSVALLSAGLVVAIDGCSATRKMASNPTGKVEATPPKQYDWRDMSQGKDFFGKPRATANASTGGSAPAASASNTTGN